MTTAIHASWASDNPYASQLDLDWVGPHALTVEWEGYDPRPTREDADVTTSSIAGLFSAIDSAISGDIIWLDVGDYQIDGNPSRQDIPAGVTVASDGARIYSTNNHDGVFELTNTGSRLTGFRFEGSQETGSHATQSIGVFLKGDVQFDNCECYRWMSMGVYTSQNGAGPVAPHIHHCILRDNRTDGMGYGLAAYTNSDPLIEYCFFNNNRHGLAANGSTDQSYRAYNNLHGTDGEIFQFECHAPGGNRMDVRNNEFRMTERNDGGVARAYAQRDVPNDVATIDFNWIYNPLDPAVEGPGGDAGISQTNPTPADWQNVQFSNNSYGSSEPSDSQIGVQALADLNGSESPLSQTESEFQIRADREGIGLSELVEVDTAVGEFLTPEGLTYHNGQLYTGQRESPATIREWNLDGTLTGAEFTLPDADSGHTNAIKWHNGELWVSSSEARKTYILNWDGANTTVVDEIVHASPVDGSAWREIIPDSSGTSKLLFPIYRGSDAHIIDAAGARTDGTTAGHVDRSIKTGYFHNVQTMLWDGSAGPSYTTTHQHVIKHQLPALDDIGPGDPLYGWDVEFIHPLPSSAVIEQITQDPSSGEFYLLDRAGGGRILSGQESVGVYDNGNFGEWPTASVSGHLSSDVRDVNSTSTEYTRFNYGPTNGRVETWFYDDLTNPKRVYPAVEDAEGDAVNLGVATHQSFGESTYGFWDGGWSDTGINRVEGWVGFRWVADGITIKGEISTDGGVTWQDAGTSSRGVGSIQGIRLQRYEGSALVGPWDVRVRRNDLYSTPDATTTLSWDSQSDWDNATSRTRMVSKTLGDRQGDTFQLGFDPGHGILANSGVEYWSLDEEGTTVEGHINGNTGTVNGATMGVPGVLGSTAAEFDGVSNSITIPGSPSLSFNGSFSIFAIIDPDTNDETQTILRNGFVEPGTTFLDLRDNGRIGFGFYDADGNGQFSTTYVYQAVAANQRQVIGGAFNQSQGNLRVYLDGLAATHSVSANRPAPSTDQEWVIGRRETRTDRPFDGVIDEVILFDSALSTVQFDNLAQTLQSGSFTLAPKRS